MSVYILAKSDTSESYYGWGCKVVERLESVHIVECIDEESAQWQMGRLASGLKLVRGRLELWDTYETLEHALVDALELDALNARRIESTPMYGNLNDNPMSPQRV